MYRLLADVLNDTAFILDCLSPTFPKPVRVVILSFSSVLRALCGVAAGSAKASLSAHFAKRDNLGELNAKDSSQETVISLLGMLAGSLVVSWITTPMATWTTLILLLSIHLETNRRAVRAVRMRTLNRQRATLVFHHLRRGHVPTPEEVSKQEHIFERDGVLRSSTGGVLGYCNIGSSLSRLLKVYGTQHAATNSTSIPEDVVPTLISLYKDQGYILWSTGKGTQRRFEIALKISAMVSDPLIAWWQTLLLAEQAEPRQEAEKPMSPAEFEVFGTTLNAAADLLAQYRDSLIDAGWVLNTTALETRASTRLAADG